MLHNIASLHFRFMHWYNYLVTILLAGFIGWATIWFAVKMLFRPHHPINLLGYQVQGIFQKNQSKLAEKLGEMVSDDLLPFVDLEKHITSSENLEKLKPEIEKHVDKFLNQKLKDVFPILSKFIGIKTTNQLKDAFMVELETMFPTLMRQYMAQLKVDIDLEKIVIDKVSGFSSEKLEDIFKKITKKEFQFLEIAGGLFGCIMGTIQVVFNIITH